MALYNLEFLNEGQVWPPQSERGRLEIYQRNKKLFNESKKPIFDFRDVRIVLNYFKILSLKIADLCVGNEPPVIVADNLDTLNRIKNRNNFNEKLYKDIVDVSRYGDGVKKLRYDGRLILDIIDPSIYYKVVDEDNISDVLYHVIAYKFKIGDSEYLRAEIHGFDDGGYYIENRVYSVVNGIIKQRLNLSNFKRFENLEEKTYTGVDNFLIFTTSNSITSDAIYGEDDYSICYSLVKALENNINQINSVLKKNSDPTMVGPASIIEPVEETVTQQQADIFGGDMEVIENKQTAPKIIDPRGKFIGLDNDDRDLEYVTFDANLDAAFRNYETLTKTLYTITEMSPALWGEVNPGFANSGVALKRLLIPTLSKINRLRMINTGVYEEMLITASKLLHQFESEYEVIEDVHIKWFDGLPDDAKEVAELNEIRLRSGQASIREIKVEEGYEDVMLDEIVEEIKADLKELKGTN